MLFGISCSYSSDFSPCSFSARLGARAALVALPSKTAAVAARTVRPQEMAAWVSGRIGHHETQCTKGAFCRLSFSQASLDASSASNRERWLEVPDDKPASFNDNRALSAT